MIKTDVKISVIVPIYNDELYLKDALKSIQQQSFTEFECICVNDGSTDNSEKIIDEFVTNDNRYIKINKENGGVSSARNAGLNAAQGEYVYLMDHDDLIPVYTLQKLYEAVIRYNADMSRGRMMMIAENFSLSQLPVADAIGTKQRCFENPVTDFYKYIRRKYKLWCYVWQCLFKRSVVKDVRFVEALRAGGEDNLFMFEIVGKIKNFVQIDDIVACHRYSHNSVTLNGLNISLINMFEIKIPYIYNKYATDRTMDKRLIWWIYHKESYAAYRFLIRKTIREDDPKFVKKSREILLKFRDTAELNEIMKRWNLKQRIFFNLFMKEKYAILKALNIFM